MWRKGGCLVFSPSFCLFVPWLSKKLVGSVLDFCLWDSTGCSCLVLLPWDPAPAAALAVAAAFASWCFRDTWCAGQSASDFKVILQTLHMGWSNSLYLTSEGSMRRCCFSLVSRSFARKMAFLWSMRGKAVPRNRKGFALPLGGIRLLVARFLV